MLLMNLGSRYIVLKEDAVAGVNAYARTWAKVV